MRASSTLDLRLRSMAARQRRLTSRPGVFPEPDQPTTAVHNESGSDQPGDARTPLAGPIKLDAIASKGSHVVDGNSRAMGRTLQELPPPRAEDVEWKSGRPWRSHHLSFVGTVMLQVTFCGDRLDARTAATREPTFS